MNILFVGTPATPYGHRACDVKLAAFANIVAKNHSVCILNRYSSRENDEDIKLSAGVVVKELVSKHKAFTLFLFCLSVIIEPFVIILMNRKVKIDVLNVYSGHYLDFVLYKCIACLIGAKVVYQYDEFALDKEKRGGYFRWNAKKLDLKGPLLWDGAVCISDFLRHHASEVNPKLKTMKLTPICDFASFEPIMKANRKPYLLFCGSIGYYDVIELIVNSYRRSKISKGLDLVLVLAGNNKAIEKFNRDNTDVDVLSGLEYETLQGLYKGAVGLLIPLRNTTEDVARFPNKVCEYLAAKGLVITTRFGEMSNYFVDKKNALVADDFSVDSFADELDWLYEHMDKVNEIKETAYNDLYAIFDQDSNSRAVNDFLTSL